MAMANARPDQQADRIYWNDVRAMRPAIRNRIGADHFSPRPLLFAIPMAGFLWLTGALVGLACL